MNRITGSRYLGIIITVIMVVFVAVGIVRDPKKSDIDISDVFFEGAIVMLALTWIIIASRGVNDSRVDVPLSAGFGLLFGAFFKDLADEFVDFSPVYDLLEKGGAIAGMTLVSAGLVNWVNKLRASQKDLENQVAQRTAKLSEALDAKGALIKEIHHRVKNNLQVIESLLGLQSNASDNSFVRSALSDIRGRVRAISAVHEQLYQRDGAPVVNMPEYLGALAGNISNTLESKQNLDVLCSVGKIHLDIEQAVLCGMVVNELVSNAATHGFPDRASGRIEINMSKKNGVVVLSVEDDGVGFEEEAEPAGENTLGMKLIQAWSKQLRGTVTWSRVNGTRCSVSFYAQEPVQINGQVPVQPKDTRSE